MFFTIKCSYKYNIYNSKDWSCRRPITRGRSLVISSSSSSSRSDIGSWLSSDARRANTNFFFGSHICLCFDCQLRNKLTTNHNLFAVKS